MYEGKVRPTTTAAGEDGEAIVIPETPEAWVRKLYEGLQKDVAILNELVVENSGNPDYVELAGTYSAGLEEVGEQLNDPERCRNYCLARYDQSYLQLFKAGTSPELMDALVEELAELEVALKTPSQSLVGKLRAKLRA